MTVTGRAACLALLHLAAAPALSAETPRLLVAGDDRVLWLVRAHDKGVYDVAARPAGRKWKPLRHQVAGRLAAMASADGQLHLLLYDPTGYVIDSLDTPQPTVGRNPSDARWSDRTAALAACNATGLAGADEGASIAAVVPYRRTAEPATGPASRPVGMPDPGCVHLAVFRTVQGQWGYLTHLPNVPLGKAAPGSVHVTAVGSRLYLLASAPADGGAVSNALHVWDGRAVPQWAGLELPDSVRDAPPVGMSASPGEVLMVFAKVDRSAGRARLVLARLDTLTGAVGCQDLAREGGSGRWPASPLPGATRLKNQVAVAWQDGDGLHVATYDLGGQLGAEETVDAFVQKPPKIDPQDIYKYFHFGVMLAVLLPMFVFRGPLPTKPFTLSAAHRPAPLLKRYVAGFLDYMPFSLASAALFFPLNVLGEAPDPNQALVELAGSSEAGYAVVVSLLAYTAYCIVMEWRYGATLGKLLFGLRVVGDEGARTTPREIVMRNLVRIIEMWPHPWLPIVIVVFTMVSRYRQRLGDMLARTAVVEVVAAPPGEAGQDERPGSSERAQDEEPPGGG